MDGLYGLIQQIMGTPWPGVTILERMMVMAGAITLIMHVVGAVLYFIKIVAKGGRE